MSPDQKSLAAGILVGILVSVIVFGGGITLWKHLSSTVLKIPANQPTTITIEGRTLNFTYNPEVGKLFVTGDNKYNVSARVGFVGSWSWGRYTITEVNPDYLVLYFRPWRFTSMDEVASK